VSWPASVNIQPKLIPNLSYLLELETGSISKRSQIDQIIYAAVEITSEFLPLENSLQVTVLVDLFMSNLMRVNHSSSQDATILGFI